MAGVIVIITAAVGLEEKVPVLGEAPLPVSD
jgi:hypothetical protein